VMGDKDLFEMLKDAYCFGDPAMQEYVVQLKEKADKKEKAETLLQLANRGANNFAKLSQRLIFVKKTIFSLRDKKVAQDANRIYALGMLGVLEYIEDGDMDHIGDGIFKEELKRIIHEELYG